MPNETFDWDEARERMRQAADEGFATAWQPENPDDEIVGVLVKVTMQAPTSFGPAPVVELETPTGARYSVWLFHTVLRRAFEREAVGLGERVLIRWLGKKTPEGGGNSYDDYRLVVDRPAPKGQPDWKAMADRYGDERDEPLIRRGEDDRPGDDFGADPNADDIPFMPSGGIGF